MAAAWAGGEDQIKTAPEADGSATAARPSVSGTAAPAGTHLAARHPGGRRAGLVVAGLDASTCSRNAVDWAAAEAARRHATLRLVHAYLLPGVGHPEDDPAPDDAKTAVHVRGYALLDRVAAGQ